ncbi:MAG: 2-C-methyl-D-erythritol 2,4-cyclodiphosphate synthase, partial [Myxococcota bacterium]
REILERVAERMRSSHFEIGNLDATIIAEVPRLAPHQSAMRGRLAAALGVEEARVNLKITSSDGLGALGRGEGIGALAVVLLEDAGGVPGAAKG